jgi:hypothetical protein
MRIRVVIDAAEGEPPAGAPVIIQILDTALQDAGAVVLAETRLSWPERTATLELDAPARAYPVVSVHIDADGDGRISEGDFITMQSYPCREEMRVEVRPV